MAETYAVGNDGTITMPTSEHNGAIRVWSASFSNVSSNVTRFADTGVRRRLGIQDCTGSASGSPTFNATTTAPGTDDKVAEGSALTLGLAAGCSYALTAAVFSNINIGSDKMGDATLAFDFETASGALTVETWDETA